MALSGVRVARSLVFCVVFCRSFCPFVCFPLAIVLSVRLRFTNFFLCLLHESYCSVSETQHPSQQSRVISEAVLKSPVYDDNCSSRGRATIVENIPAKDRGKSHLVTQCKELGDILESIETQRFDLHEDIQLHQNLSAEALYSLCSKGWYFSIY